MSATTIIKEDFKHSFSSVSKFRKNPSEWLCHYALGLKSPSNAAMTRGSLAEFGAYYKIKKGMQQKDDKGFAKLIEHRFKKLKSNFKLKAELYLLTYCSVPSIISNNSSCRNKFRFIMQ